MLKLPALREHKEDIPLLAGDFCRMLAAKHGRPAVSISREVMDLFMTSDWKGNVRELKNVLESAVVLSRDDSLRAEDFPLDLLARRAGEPGGTGVSSILALGNYREAKKQFEIAYIKAKLREHRGNITRTAAAIGIHRQSLQEKLRELGIQTERE